MELHRECPRQTRAGCALGDSAEEYQLNMRKREPKNPRGKMSS